MSDAHRAAASGGHEDVWRSRLVRLCDALNRSVPTQNDLGRAIDAVIDVSSTKELWLVLYGLSGRIPTEEQVLETARRAEFVNGEAVLSTLRALTTSRSALRSVVYGRDRVMVDLGHTAEVAFRTGIQRVAVETGVRWYESNDCDLVGWTRGLDALRPLRVDEVTNLVERRPGPGEHAASPEAMESVLVPLGGAYLSPELSLDHDRLSSLARYSGLRTGVIGFDCVSLSSSETVAPGMTGAFARYLTSVRWIDRVATISHAACAEYSGWRRMLSGTGVVGPDVVAVPLSDEMNVVPDVAAADLIFAVGDLPRVLVVGSHEPRKNHLAVLAAAETLWNEGLRFSLSFVGGRTWGRDHFHRALDRLQAEGRPVAAVTGVSDAALAGGYASARFTVFPSLNEGFGLPVAESLALGTPVITSDFGSMKEIAAAGGAVLVDPRDDDQIAAAMRSLLLDDDLLDRLRTEASRRSVRTWDTYAAETWAVLTEGLPR